MEGISVHYVKFIIDIWCDCGCFFRMEGENVDCTCPRCGAVYGVLPARVDGS